MLADGVTRRHFNGLLVSVATLLAFPFQAISRPRTGKMLWHTGDDLLYRDSAHGWISTLGDGPAFATLFVPGEEVTIVGFKGYRYRQRVLAIGYNEDGIETLTTGVPLHAPLRFGDD